MISSHRDVEDLFELHERKIRHENVGATALVAIVISLLGVGLDIVVYPHMLWQLFLTRLTAAGLAYAVFRHAKKRKFNEVSRFFESYLPVIIIFSICFMVFMTDGGNSPYHSGLSLVLVALAILMRWTVIMSLKMSFILILAYTVSIIPSMGEVPISTLLANYFFLGSDVIIIVSGTYLYQSTRRSEFQLQKEVEAQNVRLEENQTKLRELDESKTRFFANISHELRTPLTIMLGTSETLKTQPEASCKERISVIHSNGLRLLGLIDNLLDLVRFDQGDEKVIREPVPAEEFFRGLMSGMGHLAERKEIQINWKAEKALPVLSLDKDKLEKIVTNILMNAVKFTDFGGEIDFTVVWKNGELSLKIVDNGVGMSEEKQAQIFSRFWQADASSNRKFRGSGIGLSLVKNLVEAMSGKISVESVEGEGSTFLVTLPAKEGVLEKREDESEVISIDPVAEMHRQALFSLPEAFGDIPEIQSDFKKDIRILIADDEEDLRRFLTIELSKDHDVIEAGDGLEALALAEQYSPDLMLLDYMMPDKNGMEVCRAVRESPRLANIPVIMLTARADEQIKLECLRAGASDFLSKPFALGELNLRVQNQISMIKFQRQLKKQNIELEEAMEQLKENEVRLIRQEKLSSLGQMSAGIIHEINNPLNYVQGAHHMLGVHSSSLSEEAAEDFKDALKDAKEGVERVSQIIADLRSFATTGSQPLRPVILAAAVDSAQKLMSNQFEEWLSVEVDIASDIEVNSNQGQLVQIFVNFFQNSIHALKDRRKDDPQHQGEISIRALRIPAPDGEQAVVCIFRDNGVGISPENKIKIFDPFFTSKEVGEGMGLGLSIVHQIMERHGIDVTLDTEVGQFTEFQLSFPPHPQPNSKKS